MNITSEMRLRALITDEARTSFQAVRVAHLDERFYAFGLLTDGEMSFIAPVSNSEEALLRKSNGYAKTPFRWSPTAWEYRHGNSDVSQEIQEILAEALDSYNDAATEEEFEAEADERYDRIISICEQVLRQLDDEGLFGVGSARNSVLVNIFFLDQNDESTVELAERLNPPEAVDRYRFELRYCREWPPEVHLSS
jgi:hypothetical protein